MKTQRGKKMRAIFYRAVSLAELANWRQSGRLQAGEGSCEGKHLARHVADARRWGLAYYEAERFAILRIEVPLETAAEFVTWDWLDGIGPAAFATIEQLDDAVVQEVTDES
jgi:hypothetical protein